MIIFYDYETTGLLNYSNLNGIEGQPHVCQLAFAGYSSDGKILSEFSTLIKPEGWTIPKEAQAVHGISTEMCEAVGISIKNALAIFKMFTKYAEVLSGFNIEGYDNKLTNIECKRLGVETFIEGMKVVDVMKICTPICKIPKARGGYKWPKLMEAHKTIIGSEFEGAHSALADVHATARVYFKLDADNLICSLPK